jgi:hypothetical protein
VPSGSLIGVVLDFTRPVNLYHFQVLRGFFFFLFVSYFFFLTILPFDGSDKGSPKPVKERQL